MITKLHYKQRLAALAKHLETGPLKLGSFDFSRIGPQLKDCTHTPTCGTMGCAIGELRNISPAFEGIYQKHWVPSEAAAAYFGIEISESQHLFFPQSQNVTKYGGKELTHSATRYEVAAGIRAFMVKKWGGG